MSESKTVLELFPNRGPGHKMNSLNSRDGCTPGDYVEAEQAWLLKPGWKLLGWASPPYPGSDTDAIVFEKTEVEAGSDEPGIYWRHGNAAIERIITSV